jgi:hypothetical protein
MNGFENENSALLRLTQGSQQDDILSHHAVKRGRLDDDSSDSVFA